MTDRKFQPCFSQTSSYKSVIHSRTSESQKSPPYPSIPLSRKQKPFTQSTVQSRCNYEPQNYNNKQLRFSNNYQISSQFQAKLKNKNADSNYKQQLIKKIDNLKEKSVRLEEARKAKLSPRISIEKSSEEYSTQLEQFESQGDVTLSNIGCKDGCLTSRSIESSVSCLNSLILKDVKSRIITQTYIEERKKSNRLAELGEYYRLADDNLNLFLRNKFEGNGLKGVSNSNARRELKIL